MPVVDLVASSTLHVSPSIKAAYVNACVYIYYVYVYMYRLLHTHTHSFYLSLAFTLGLSSLSTFDYTLSSPPPALKTLEHVQTRSSINPYRNRDTPHSPIQGTFQARTRSPKP